MKIDSDWFMRQIQESPYGSMRRIATRIRNRLGKPIQASNLSRMLSGEREMQLHEARQLADLLGQPMSEIIRRAGIPFGKRDNLPEEAELPVLIKKSSAGSRRA